MWFGSHVAYKREGPWGGVVLTSPSRRGWKVHLLLALLKGKNLFSSVLLEYFGFCSLPPSCLVLGHVILLHPKIKLSRANTRVGFLVELVCKDRKNM